MFCARCGGDLEVAKAGRGRCTVCRRLFALEGGALTEIRVEPPGGAPRTEFLALFEAELGLPRLPAPARGMRGFELLAMKDGAEEPLEGRASRTKRYAARTFDMVRALYRCPVCGTGTPQPAPFLPNRAPYRSVSEIAAALPGLVEAAVRAGHGPVACASGMAPVLERADHHVYCTLTGRDLVVRHAPEAAASSWDWSLEAGYAPRAASPELDHAVARDAIFRTLAALRETFDEDEDLESFAAVLQEGIEKTPENPDFLRFFPRFLLNHGGRGARGEASRWRTSRPRPGARSGTTGAGSSSSSPSSAARATRSRSGSRTGSSRRPSRSSPTTPTRSSGWRTSRAT